MSRGFLFTSATITWHLFQMIDMIKHSVLRQLALGLVITIAFIIMKTESSNLF